MSAQGLLEVFPIADGFWRWTAPHPEWTPEKDRPDGWARMVGSVYFEPAAGGADALALVDPLAPPAGSAEAGKFWTALDRDVERAGLRTAEIPVLVTELRPARSSLLKRVPRTLRGLVKLRITLFRDRHG